jgi:plastocyanin
VVPGSAPAGPDAGARAAAAPAPAGAVDVAFTPAAVTVRIGTTVVWTNNDAVAHTVDFATQGVNSSALNPGDRFTRTFTTAGTYDYSCSIHPFMHGSVTVTD